MSTINLKKQYQKEIRLVLQKEFSEKNILATPSIKKVVINVGVGKILNNASSSKNAEDLLNDIKKRFKFNYRTMAKRNKG
jgi:ribosomal protein L5